MTLFHFLVSGAMNFAASAGVFATPPMPGFLDIFKASGGQCSQFALRLESEFG